MAKAKAFIWLLHLARLPLECRGSDVVMHSSSLLTFGNTAVEEERQRMVDRPKQSMSL